MPQKHPKNLIVNVLMVGVIIAVLSYVFYPGVGQFSVMINGEPVAEPLIRFAAVPTFLLIMMVTGVLMVSLFLGVGMLMFLGVMFVALIGIFIMAPYVWPALIIILLAVALMTVSNDNKA
ncbi:MAG: hypothetical protein PSV18_05635 [Methylobacter sp.]|uniref:Uncharacterized protein n=1 Tax=Candidatus Methylobacter titanis TaxID=3053457 RepID=A0AA43TJZ5_9GAMM|nr:hypothetical protein [Candidatus Methylobacter titanis]MDI1292209.1 hypothetical protein [Candidatus Methylobacter titanis]